MLVPPNYSLTPLPLKLSTGKTLTPKEFREVVDRVQEDWFILSPCGCMAKIEHAVDWLLQTCQGCPAARRLASKP